MIIEEIRSGPIVNMDETTVQVLAEPGRANTTKSFMWVARGGIPEKPVVLFRYYPTRAASVAAEILGDFKGYLQTDGYSGYRPWANGKACAISAAWPTSGASSSRSRSPLARRPKAARPMPSSI